MKKAADLDLYLTWSAQDPAQLLRERDAEIEGLRADLARSERHRRALADVIMTAGSSLRLQDLLDRVVSIVANATGADAAFVYVWDPETERLVLRAATEGDQRPFLNAMQLRLGEGVTGWSALMRRPAVVNAEPLRDPRFKYFPELKEERFQAMLTAPVLVHEEDVVGVFTLYSLATGYFGDEHLHTAMEVASLLAGVIETTRLYDQAARKANVLGFLGDLASTLTSHRSIEETLHSVAAMTVEVMESELCVIVLLDPSRAKLVLKSVAPARSDLLDEAEQTIYQKVLDLAQTENSDPLTMEEVFRELALALPEHFEEVTSAPLIAGSNQLGFISCFRSLRYTTGDRELLATIGAQVALALKAAQLTDARREHDPTWELLRLMMNGGSSAKVSSMAAALGCDLSKPHVVLRCRVLPAEGQDQTELPDRIRHGTSAVAQVVSTFNPGSLLNAADGEVTGLVRVARPEGAVQLRGRLEEVCSEVVTRLSVFVSVGMSSVCTGLLDYAGAGREAAEALEIGAKVWGEGHVVRFEEIGPYVYLYRIAADPHAGRDPYMSRLAALVEYDQRKRTRLLDTLDCYLECRGNGSLAAERLLVHRNTLRQRLERIEALTGMQFARVEDWFPLQLAVKLAKLRVPGAPREGLGSGR